MCKDELHLRSSPLTVMQASLFTAYLLDKIALRFGCLYTKQGDKIPSALRLFCHRQSFACPFLLSNGCLHVCIYRSWTSACIVQI